MKKRSKLLAILLMGVLCTAVPCQAATEAEETTQESGFVADEEGTVALKATGMATYSFTEEQDEEWADGITAVYLSEFEDGAEAPELTEDQLVSDEKYTVSTVKMILDSDLFPVDPSTSKTYLVSLEAEGYDTKTVKLTVQNLTPTEFVIRTVDGEGNIEEVKTYTYEELAEMCTTESYFSFGCVMHGLVSAKAEGIPVMDLLADAGIEFVDGMSLAVRTTDAPATIEATEMNSGEKTGEVVENPEKYWMKPRFTDRFKHSYEELYGRTRYFLTAPWEDEKVAEMLTEDEGKFSFEVREALAANPDYMEEVVPMIALKYTTLQYTSDPTDIREAEDDYYDLTANERAFRFFYGLALDDDPTVNVTAYDDELGEYPVVETPENEGKTAIEEGSDACGISARQAMLVFGIDVFTE